MNALLDFLGEHWAQVGAAVWLVGAAFCVLFLFCAGKAERES